jgi:CBS domain-containing protein
MWKVDNMAIAIRIDATKTNLKWSVLVDNYTREGRPAIRVACRESKCQQEYVVYHGPSIDEAQLREGLAPYLRRDHPNHPMLYEIVETPDNSRKIRKVRPLYQKLQVSSTKVGDVMTDNPVCCVPSDTVQRVASLMKDEDVGCLPVVDEHSSRRLLGVITDRDVCCRVAAAGHNPQNTAIEPYITRNVITCLADDELKHCLELLRKHGIHRVPVVDEKNRCTGIIALADVPESAEKRVRRELARAINSTLKRHGF